MPKVVLVVLSASNLDQRQGGKLRSSKLHPYISGGLSLGVTFKFVLLREESIGLQRSEYSFLRLPYSVLFWTFSLLSFFLRRMGLMRAREWALKEKSSVQHSSWNRVIKLVKANAVIGIGLPQELLQAARDLNIPTIEVQHGSLDLPTFRSYWPIKKPTYLFCWNSRTAELSSEFGVVPIIVGHPILKEIESTLSDTRRSSSWQKSAFSTFCVALAWGVRNSLDPYNSIHLQVAQAVDYLISKGLRPIFRLHPYYEARPVTRLLLVRWIKRRWMGIEVQSPRGVSLLNSILASDFLVSHSSAAAYEFAIMNKPSVLLDLEAAHRARLEIGHRFGGNTVVPSCDQLLRQGRFAFAGRDKVFLGSEKLVEILEGY